ncbi:YciI family protein [Actinotalea solisilvae]|uniref:YciI family protein n=1 Tax=Actinotalea solisilvae TaxID=2072922 RepID=UPI0018F1AE16|nr:YciI family protein [Actinotalea solisilvae]
MGTYLIAVYEPAGPPPPAEFLEPVMRAVEAVDQEIRAAGQWVFAGGLHDPSTATVLRAQDGDVVLTDGPFAEVKEHLGGFTIVDVPDLDAALGWGRRIATATGLPIEVRPFRW